MSIDKSLLTSLSAIVLTLAGFLMPQPPRAYVSSAGLFAVSGALTNWLAVYMLFERVPGFYGSGVVPLHFAEFKAGMGLGETDHLIGFICLGTAAGPGKPGPAADGRNYGRYKPQRLTERF